MYPAVISLIEIALTNWSSYDGWCLSKGIDPLELPSRRFVNSIWTWLSEGLDQEKLDELLSLLTQTSYITKKKDTPPPSPTPTPTDTPKVSAEYNSKDKWKAPEGWTPPGWDEERSYSTALNFMEFNANPK